MKTLASSPIATRNAMGLSCGGHRRDLRLPIRATMIPAIAVVIMKEVGRSVGRPAHPGRRVPVFSTWVRMDRSISRQ
ncbi:MAG: hypothetical protein KAY24_14535, partial [Candidatus Eisenbacteria sp.]|nr:hypothetical protein [Candidatus Eisenbacteria bacterium]